MFEILFYLSTALLVVVVFYGYFTVSLPVRKLGATLSQEIWNIKSKGSIWYDCNGSILILPNARKAKHAYIKYEGIAHECSKFETLFLYLMARKALEERKKGKRV